MLEVQLLRRASLKRQSGPSRCERHGRERAIKAEPVRASPDLDNSSMMDRRSMRATHKQTCMPYNLSKGKAAKRFNCRLVLIQDRYTHNAPKTSCREAAHLSRTPMQSVTNSPCGWMSLVHNLKCCASSLVSMISPRLPMLHAVTRGVQLFPHRWICSWFGVSSHILIQVAAPDLRLSFEMLARFLPNASACQTHSPAHQSVVAPL